MIPPTKARRARTHDETLCINCGCAGHFRSECLAPSWCPTTLAYLGYGVEGVASTMWTRALRRSPSDRTWLRSPLSQLSSHRRRFWLLLRSTGKSCRRTLATTGIVPFPSAEMLNVCTRDHVKCPINKFMISIQKADAEPDTVAPLD